MNFAEMAWSIIFAFLFLSYLLLLWKILGDLWLDRDLSGWVKALWVLCLLVAPIASALVYLILRGTGMSLRSELRVGEENEMLDKHRQYLGGNRTPVEQIESAKALMDGGAITQEEFQRLKAAAMSVVDAPVRPLAT